LARMFLAAWILVLGCLPQAAALSVRGAGVALGKTAERPVERISFLSIDQPAGPMPLYVKYGAPEFTTFNNVTSACQACVTFWPMKEDGKRFHSKLYDDPSGGVWVRSCRASKCDFRDPQTDPVGGVIGRGVGPGGMPDGKTCMTRDPVPWFTDCEPVLLDAAHTVLDATRYCSYREQIFIPPPVDTVSRFAGKPVGWARIGGTQEQCLATIEKEGSALFDEMNMCDANLPALSGCCETVYSGLTCLAETAFTKTGMSKQDVFATMTDEAAQMLEAFSKYCVPLCQNTKEEFCAKNPGADICLSPKGCTGCTKRGGIWCPKLESCHCPSKNPPCIKPPITTPLQCLDDGQKHLRGDKDGKMDLGDGAGRGAGAKDDALCKYSEMARNWKPK